MGVRSYLELVVIVVAGLGGWLLYSEWTGELKRRAVAEYKAEQLTKAIHEAARQIAVLDEERDSVASMAEARLDSLRMVQDRTDSIRAEAERRALAAMDSAARAAETLRESLSEEQTPLFEDYAHQRDLEVEAVKDSRDAWKERAMSTDSVNAILRRQVQVDSTVIQGLRAQNERNARLARLHEEQSQEGWLAKLKVRSGWMALGFGVGFGAGVALSQ